jgi:hypothetical protein
MSSGSLVGTGCMRVVGVLGSIAIIPTKVEDGKEEDCRGRCSLKEEEGLHGGLIQTRGQGTHSTGLRLPILAPSWTAIVEEVKSHVRSLLCLLWVHVP